MEEVRCLAAGFLVEFIDSKHDTEGNWSRLIVKCPTSAKPQAKIKWFCNGKLDKHDGENIYVKITTVKDYKNYMCEASNSIGADNVTFVLHQVGPPTIPAVSCGKREDTSNSRTYKLLWNAPKDDGGAPISSYMVKYRTLRGHVFKGSWQNVNVSHTETWCKLELNWDTTYELTVTAWNIYGESKLDLDTSSCVVKIGTAAAAKESTGGKSSVHVAVYVLPGIGLLVIIIVIALLIRRRRARNHRVKTNWAEQHVSFNAVRDIFEPPTSNGKLLGPRAQQTMVGSPCYQMDPQWMVPRERICILKVIGNGAFGLVYKGRIHGVGSSDVGWSIVAIKSPYGDATDSEVRDLMKEFELLKTLKPHPHVIKLLGCGEGDGRPLVIIEYVPYGDLLGYLRKSRGENDDYYSDPEIKPNTNLSSQQLLRFGWNVADGMAYLASEKIIHRDLAARNVLVGKGLACKITDFGMAKDVSNDDIYVRTTEGRLPVKWTAIEALTGSGEYTTKSDVWSFGVVLYEICTIGSDPYPGIIGKEIPDRIQQGYRMPRPSHVDPVVYDVMFRCWNKVPDERPTFPQIKETLMKLEDNQAKIDSVQRTPTSASPPPITTVVVGEIVSAHAKSTSASLSRTSAMIGETDRRRDEDALDDDEDALDMSYDSDEALSSFVVKRRRIESSSSDEEAQSGCVGEEGDEVGEFSEGESDGEELKGRGKYGPVCKPANVMESLIKSWNLHLTSPDGGCKSANMVRQMCQQVDTIYEAIGLKFLTKMSYTTGTEHRVTSAYHPQSNGLDERFNQTLQRTLRKCVNEQQDNWDEAIDDILFAY
ncbi:hypothetical protein QZH41_005123 [Actinostola sp. cb2023]|nr:hypothetical protein QZH41_005123 [Actinostola sp. cb2023]